MANAKKSWKEVFTENYLGKSDLAKEVEPFLKDNYKGNAYIPWATMERLTYMCDEDAVFENIKNPNGGLVHTDVMEMHQQNIQKGEVVSETVSQMFSHMVKVKLVFMGKKFIEEYPIQDQDYSAARVFNQNLVNKALQRAKAKVASRATGIGFKLYEGKDLQFDEVPQETKPQLPVENVENTQLNVKKSQKTTKNDTKIEKTVEKVEEKPVVYTVGIDTAKGESVQVEAQIETQPATQNDPVSEAVYLIKNTDVDKMNLALQRVNVALMKKHKVALSTQASDEDLRTILSNKTIFSNPEQFLKTLKTLLGV
ncbi:MAG: hypothetical protein VZQ62_00390 [Methanosphaera sp.]|nr:hypothetical protein [Methanosphaera sp.]